MFAEDIGGWLAAGALLLGSLASSVLALGALYPASQGMKSLTVCLITPAIIVAFIAIYYFVGAYTHRSLHDREEILVNYIQPWLVMGFPPLITSGLSGALLIWKRRKK